MKDLELHFKESVIVKLCLDIYNFMGEKKKKQLLNVTFLMINLQREIIWVAVGFQKVLTICLFAVFNLFDDFP